MGTFLLVCICGGLGAVARFMLNTSIQRWWPRAYPLSTFIINIIAASNIARNLYLTIQLLELGVPVVLALNMMDEAAKQGMTIDIERLSQRLGFPVMATVARTGDGQPELLKATAA